MNIDADFDSAFFETKYGKLHYKHHDGNTTPIVFLHGLAASVKSWTRLVEFLPDSLDIYLVDLIGHGMSEAPKIEYTLKMQYEILCDFIKRAVGRPTVLFGHSYGGWLAAYYAAYNDAEGLVLESPSGLREFMENRKIYNTGYIEHMVKRALTLNPREYVLRSTLNADNSGMLLDAGVLSMIKCKCLIVWGSGDDLISPAYADSFHRLIKGSVLDMINAKHTPHYGTAEKVAELLTRFLTYDEGGRG